MGSSASRAFLKHMAFVDRAMNLKLTLETEESDSVKILTVHKSKGLEFPIVVIGDMYWKKETPVSGFSSMRRISHNEE